MADSLYQNDFVLWTEQQAQSLEKRDLAAIDWEHLLEEILALGRSEKYELQNRLEVLLEHLLKRCYVNNIYDNRGWELTVKEQRKQIKRLLKASPSLKNYLSQIFGETWEDALSDIQDLYPSLDFPQDCPFPDDLESLLSGVFWR
ncbi:DUF29 domain-containing protein [Spirulina subsalsa]|uniref:DUF29 domain-containing protein n=1 Tax=Spirulina subsalsa TaxID=54311 RepID=UPI000316AB8A|nr:DUF29 domain-containing protein [Spirulina subsalsa]